MSERSMSERQRVFLALQGKLFPRVGAIGLFTRHPRQGTIRALVEVVRVSPTGQIIWTRFTHEEMRARCPLNAEIHRWWRVPDDDFGRFDDRPLYRAGRDAVRAPTGEISFPDVLPVETAIGVCL